MLRKEIDHSSDSQCFEDEDIDSNLIVLYYNVLLIVCDS